jgi:hypothetical protein
MATLKSMRARLARALAQLSTAHPAPASSAYSGATQFVGQVKGGCVAGVILADGSVVQLPGEPPPYRYNGWWPPTKKGD